MEQEVDPRPNSGNTFRTAWTKGLFVTTVASRANTTSSTKNLPNYFIVLGEIRRTSFAFSIVVIRVIQRSDAEPLKQLTSRKARSARDNSDERSLDSYLDGFYSSEVKRKGGLVIHTARHILLAACRHDQKAWESDSQQGMFTQSLIEVLEQSPPDISYSDLFVRCRHAVRKRIVNQEPHFATFHKFDSGAGFLGHPNQQRRKRFNVFFDENWQVNCGAIHGLPTDFDVPAEFSVFENADSNQPFGCVTAAVIGTQNSQIDESGLAVFENIAAAKESVFPATITSLPVPPLSVLMIGDTDSVEPLSEMVTNDSSLGISLACERANQQYAFKVQAEQFVIVNLRTNENLHTVLRNTDDAELYLLSVLKRIARWERAILLRNKSSRLDRDLFDFEFHAVVPQSNDSSQPPPMVGDSNFTGVERGRGDSFETRIQGELRVRNRNRQALHVTLLHFSDDFGISCLYSEPIECSEQWVTLTPCGESLIGFFLKACEPTGSATQFKVIVSTEKIDDFLLEQDAVPKGVRDTSQRNRRPGKNRKINNDWFAKDLKIQLFRQQGKVTAKGGEFFGGRLKLHPNSNIRAGIFEIPPADFVRGLPKDRLAIFLEEHPQLTPIVFSGENTCDTNRIVGIEISEFENTHQFRESPLVFELDVALDPRERVLPAWFDGEHAVFEETSQGDGGKISFTIDRMPESDSLSESTRPSIRLYFFKTRVASDKMAEIKQEG